MVLIAFFVSFVIDFIDPLEFRKGQTAHGNTLPFPQVKNSPGLAPAAPL